MARRFVALAEGLTREESSAFIKFLNDQGCGYWHWIENSWLITEGKKTLSAELIRDELLKVDAKRGSILVFEVRQAGPWYGFGPNSGKRNMFDWLRNSWPGSG